MDRIRHDVDEEALEEHAHSSSHVHTATPTVSVTRTVFDGGAALCCIGLALLVATDWAAELIIDDAGVEQTGSAAYLSGILSIIVFIACALCHRRIEAWCANAVHTPQLIVIGILAGLGRIFATFGISFGLWEGIAYIGLAVQALAEAFLLMVMLAACCRDERSVPIIFPAAYVLASCIHFVLRAIDAWAVGVIVVALPIIAALLYIAYLRYIAAHNTDTDEPDEEAGISSLDTADRLAASPDGKAAEHESWSFPIRPVVLMTVYTLVFHFSLALSEGPNPYGPLGMLVISVIALAVALALSDRYSPSLLYKIALPLMVAGLMGLAFLDDVRPIAVLFTNSANVAFTLFILIALGAQCRHYGISPYWAFGIVYAFSSLAGMVGNPLGDAVVSALPLGSAGLSIVMVIVILAVIVLSTIFFNDSVVARSFGMVPANSTMTGPQAVMSYSERIVWRCSKVSRRYGLTQREQEILELLVQEDSIPVIAERAVISYGTAKTHINHIYHKLGVHTREEAIAIVEHTN